MRRLFCLLALLGAILGGCGDDYNYGKSWSSSEKEATVVGSFAFTPTSLTNVAPETEQVSEPEVVNLYGTYADISVVNGEYSINFGTFVSGPGIVRNGDRVMVRHTSASSPNQTVTTTLTIGDKSALFSSTTGTTPANVALNAESGLLQLNMPPSVTAQFEPVTVTMPAGYEAPVSIELGEYSVNGGPFVTTSGTVHNNDQIRIRHVTATGGADTTVTTTLTVSNVTMPFTTSTTGIATQKISLTAAPYSYATAPTRVLSSGPQTVRVQEGFGMFSFDENTFYENPQYADLKAGQMLYLTDMVRGSGQTDSTTYKIGDTQVVIFETTGIQ